MYLRYAALGDSATVGIGDPVPGGWRGWSRLLSSALATAYDVSYCNLAVSGATSTDVLHGQLADAVAHRPDVASLVVGVNDTMRAGWHPGRVREELMTCASALHDAGATLLTARFHDHGAIFGLPGVLRRPLYARIEAVNAVYDEVHATFGGHRIDLGRLAQSMAAPAPPSTHAGGVAGARKTPSLPAHRRLAFARPERRWHPPAIGRDALAARPDVYDRAFWSVDRLHPSELGHRALARGFADLLVAAGLEFEPPALEPQGGQLVGWRQDVAWMVREGAPWVGRRARDLGPWAVRMAWEETRPRRTPVA